MFRYHFLVEQSQLSNGHLLFMDTTVATAFVARIKPSLRGAFPLNVFPLTSLPSPPLCIVAGTSERAATRRIVLEFSRKNVLHKSLLDDF